MLNKSFNRPNLHHWKINKSILSDPVRVMEIEKAIKKYFLLNNVAEVSAETLWIAHKATIRGKLIQLSTQIKRERMVSIDRLEKEFTQMQRLYVHKDQVVFIPGRQDSDQIRRAINIISPP